MMAPHEKIITKGVKGLLFLRDTVNKRRMRQVISSFPLIMSTGPYPRLEDVADHAPENVLVLAPHPDDEVIGCGGTIIQHAANGSKVLVAYMTDGQDGGLGLERDNLSKAREGEAREGLRVMGCTEAIFMSYPDRELHPNADHCARDLKRIMEEFRPTSVFVPFALDIHPDHVATAWILAKALRKTDIEPWCYSYEVWTTLIPNTVIDVSSTMPQKMRALAEHESQLKYFDYSERIKGLNAYRSMYVGDQVEYCEAFIKQPAHDYVRLVSGLKLNKIP